MRPPETKEGGGFADRALSNTSSENHNAQHSTRHRVLLDLEKNNREQLRVTISPFKVRDLIHLRGWYAGENGEYDPGKGTTIRPEHIPQIVEGLQRAAREVA